MDFKFLPIESRIYDFIEFPSLIYAYNELAEIEEEHLKNINTDEFKDFIKNAENLLKPYEKEIQKFYSKGTWECSDFPYLILRANSVFGFQNEEEYLNLLLSLDENKIRQSIIYTILKEDDKFNFSDKETIDKAEALSKNTVDMMAFIKGLQIDSGAKWNIFLIIEEPLKHMKMYVELMLKILPIYQNIYRNFEDNVNSYGENLVDFFKKHGATGINEKTLGIVDSKILSDETNNILISVVSPYSIVIESSVDTHFFIWGLNIDDAFKAMKEKNENKLNERVLIFKNLGDKTRYEVVKHISAGECSTKKIATALDVSSATISYHINALLNGKIIKLDKSNNKYTYVVDWDSIESAFLSLKEDLSIKNK